MCDVLTQNRNPKHEKILIGRIHMTHDLPLWLHLSNSQQIQCDRAHEDVGAGADHPVAQRHTERERERARWNCERDEEAAGWQTQVATSEILPMLILLLPLQSVVCFMPPFEDKYLFECIYVEVVYLFYTLLVLFHHCHSYHCTAATASTLKRWIK